MLKILRHDSVEKVLVILPEDIRCKILDASYDSEVQYWYGDNLRDVLARAIHEIAYRRGCEAHGIQQPDGNWIEFVNWTTIPEEMMWRIEELMKQVGWVPGVEEW